MEKIVIIKRGCPFCKGDVAGNSRVLFLCRRCFIYLDEKHIRGRLFEERSRIRKV